MRIAVRTDASARIGGGHVMRCLTLADLLAERGAEVSFVTSAMPDGLRGRVEGRGFPLLSIASDVVAEGADWDASASGDAEQDADATRTMAALGSGRLDWIVVDHYRLGLPWERRVRAWADRLLVIDDLANRSHDCDLLLDQTYGRDDRDYGELIPAGAETLTGATFALLRPEFAAARPAALARRFRGERPQRLLVSLGMTDVGGMTVDALLAAVALEPRLEIDVVLGSAAPTLERVAALAREAENVRLHVDTPCIHDLMVAADLAIGAAGATTWERCCLGLPTITLALAANQGTIARTLAEAGAIHLIGRAERAAIRGALELLLDDGAYCQQLARRSAEICDGRGAGRVADRLLGAGTTT